MDGHTLKVTLDSIFSRTADYRLPGGKKFLLTMESRSIKYAPLSSKLKAKKGSRIESLICRNKLGVYSHLNEKVSSLGRMNQKTVEEGAVRRRLPVLAVLMIFATGAATRAQSAPSDQTEQIRILLERVQQLEKRVADLETKTPAPP